MTATATNGKPPRKQLSDQLDRLDGMVDLLADRLPEAVADATREGARQAVRDVLLEILTNPELRAMIAGLAPVAPPRIAVTPPAPPPAEPGPMRPGPWTRLKAKCRAARDAVAGRCKAAATGVAATAVALSAVMPLKQIVLVGAVVGAAVGVASYLCPHGVSAVIGGVGGMCTAVGVQVGNWFRRSARSLGFGGTS